MAVIRAGIKTNELLAASGFAMDTPAIVGFTFMTMEGLVFEAMAARILSPKLGLIKFAMVIVNFTLRFNSKGGNS
jgi:hypothetical protein